MTNITDDSNDTVIFCSHTNRIIENVPQGIDAAKLIESLAPRYGDKLITLPFEDAYTRFEAGFKSEPEEITAERFDEMLCVLPPVAWKADHNGESFKICERIAGYVTGIYVKLGERYFTFSDDIRTPHHECCRRIADHLTLTPNA